MQKHSVPEIMIAMTSALVLEAVLLVGQAFAQEGKGVKVRIAQAAIASAFAPYWVASQRGMFKSNGIDVDLTLLGPAASSQALASDDIDILSASGEGINLRAEGMDVKYFGTVNHVLDFGLYARKGGPSSISAREFEGKSIAVTSPGSATDILLVMFLPNIRLTTPSSSFFSLRGFLPFTADLVQDSSI